MTALLAAIGVLAAGLVLLRVSEWGPAAGGDSLLYVGTASSLLAGDGLASFYGDPYGGAPPLFPLALAFAGLFGPHPLDAAGWLNAAAFGLTAFAAAAWVRSRTRSSFLAAWTGLACALSVPLAAHASAAMTEALFVLFAVLSLYALDRWLEGRRTSLLLAAAACAALACTTRYLGLALVMGMLPVALLADGRGLRPTRRRAAHAALLAAVALPPLGAWMLWSLLTQGSPAGGVSSTGWDTPSALYVLAGEATRQALGEGGSVLLDASAAALRGGDPPPAGVALRAATLLALAGGAAASLPLLSRRERRGLVVPAAFAAAYAPATLFLNWYLDFDLATRYLAPLFPPLLVAAAIVLSGLLRRASERGPLVRLPLPGRAADRASAPALALAAALVLWLPQQIDANYGDIREWRAEGKQHTSRWWSELDTVRWLRAHPPPAGLVLSNGVLILYFAADLRTPHEYLPRELPAAAALLAGAHASGEDVRIVWFHRLERADYRIADLAALPGVEAAAILEDGVVFRVGDPAAPRAALAETVLDGARLLASSGFGVYLDEARNRLVYVREGCAAGDTDASFFLRAYPVDAGARPSGFGNLGFAFGEHGFREDGRCLAVRNLPDWPVAAVATGQQTPDRGELWSVRVPVLGQPAVATIDVGALRARAAPLASGAPFEVYRDGGRLVYAREDCAAGDLVAPFFLHVRPLDPADLPEERRESGFDNLDFAFDEAGARDGGRCVAERALPAYPIASIRTGQWLRGEGETWAVEAAFGERAR